MSSQEQDSPSLFRNKNVEKNETLSRFIFSNRYFSGGKVKYGAFLPPKESQEISLYRINNLNEDEIWTIDNIYVSGKRGETSIGRADLIAKAALDQNLTIDPNGEPHDRHANICFPKGSQKEQQRLIALKLAEASNFVSRKNIT